MVFSIIQFLVDNLNLQHIKYSLTKVEYMIGVITATGIGSITSRCSGKEPAFLPRTHGWAHGLSIVNFDQ